MKRTTVFLSDELYEHLRAEAYRSRVSMAQLIRSRLDGRKTRPATRKRRDPLRAVEGLCKDGKLSKGIDEALYGI